MKKMSLNIVLYIIIGGAFTCGIIGICRQKNDEKTILNLHSTSYQLNEDSLIKATISDSISGIIYIANTNCSKCLAELLEFVNEFSKYPVDEHLYIATTDTMLLNYILQREYFNSKDTDYLFSTYYIKEKSTSILCNGFIIKHDEYNDITIQKYQPGCLNRLFNLNK